MIAWQLVKEQLQKDFTAPGRNNISQFQFQFSVFENFPRSSLHRYNCLKNYHTFKDGCLTVNKKNN